MAEPPATAKDPKPAQGPGSLTLREKQAAALLGVSPRTLWAWAASGTVPYVKVGGVKLYRRADLEAWVESLAGAQPGKS